MNIILNQLRKNITYLHVAEKNSIAKEVAKILSQGSQRIGHTESQYNQVYEFKMNGDEHICSSVTGHIFSKRLPQFCQSWQNFDNSLILTRAVPIQFYLEDGTKPVVKNLQNLAKKASSLILWLDCDREGEAIAFEVMGIIKNIAPKISIHRARFGAVTQEDVQNAFNNLVQPNALQADAVNFRQELDFRTGCAFTRFQTISMGKALNCRIDVVSYGLCQIPTLSIVVDRYLQIINFKSEKYWTIQCNCILNENSSVEFKWARKNTRDEIQANAIYAKIYEKAQKNSQLYGKVLRRTTNPKKKLRPYPLATIQFQKIATDKLKISAAEAMSIAEKLYQNGYISYPRTETNSFPATMNIKELLGRFIHGQHSKYIKDLEEGKYQQPKKGAQSDQAHVPIHPTKSISKDNLTNSEWQVYDLILRHFLACCSKDATALESEVIAEVGGQNFKASYLTIKERNFLQIYPFQNWAQTAFAAEVPDQFLVLLKIIANQTKPPSYLTESELIGLMEKNHIGTDSTIHEHIKTIQDRRYAVKKNNTFKPTSLGASLVIVYRKFGIALADCSLRRKIQQTMNEVASGRIKKDEAALQTLQSFLPIFNNLQSRYLEWIEEIKQSIKQHHRLDPVDLARKNDENSTSFKTTTNKIICFSCNEPGHLATKCPRRNKSSESFQTNTPSPKKKVQKKDKEKKNGKEKKETTKIPKKKNQLKSSSRDNKEEKVPKNEAPYQKKKIYTCYTCNQVGHIAPNCPRKMKQEQK